MVAQVETGDYWFGQTGFDGNAAKAYASAADPLFCPIRFQGQWEDAETGLSIDKLKGEIATLGRLDYLTDLRLYGASLTSLAGIGDAFPKLETLVIEGQRKVLDVTPLTQCKALKHLKFDGFTKTEGMNGVQIPHLEAAFVSRIEGDGFIANHPSLAWFRTKKYEADVSQALTDRGWGKYGFGGEAMPPALFK